MIGHTLFRTASAAGVGVLLFASCKDGPTPPPTPVPTQLAILTPPSAAGQSGVALAQQPVIQLRDVDGADAPVAGTTVTASIASGGGTLTGTAAVQTDANGRATFSGLGVTGTVGARTLQFSAPGLTAATSGNIDLAAGPAADLAITVQPADTARNGAPLSRQPEVQVRDGAGNDVGQAGITVSVSIASGGGTFSLPAPATTDATGHAAFADLALSGLVGDRTLRFSATGLTAVTSAVVALRPGVATQVVITTQPSDTAMDTQPFGRQPVVQLRDGSGNDVDSAGVDVTPSIASGPGTLSPLTPVATDADGQAAFSGLSITGTGEHQLAFDPVGLQSVTSTDVVVTMLFPCALLTPGDADGDRLPNCVETNTGIFVDVNDTGTDPNDTDTDNDLLPDGDEVLGTLQDLDLPAMGVNPLKKNILIEYDWFDDNLDPGTCGAHSHRPTAAIATMVSNAFAAAPISNPDGTTGITVIHDYGQGGALTEGNLIADADGLIIPGVNGTEFQNHKAANFDANRNGYFYYVILPHRYGSATEGSSGQAELPGDDMIVSLYCFGSTTNVAHTIMHELGHNLNLQHGGNVDLPNYKPNYNSVMNYLYQFPGIDNNCTPPGNGVLNYSVGTRPSLNENNLDETQGVCGNPPGPGWDWNLDTDATDVGIAVDINRIDGTGAGDGLMQTLQDFNDWAAIIFTGLSNADGARLFAQPRQVVSCTNPPPEAKRR